MHQVTLHHVKQNFQNKSRITFQATTTFSKLKWLVINECSHSIFLEGSDTYINVLSTQSHCIRKLCLHRLSKGEPQDDLEKQCLLVAKCQCLNLVLIVKLHSQ